MAVLFGGDIASYAVDPDTLQPKRNAQLTLYTDAALTTLATGLTTVDGSAISGPITDSSGFYRFLAPTGTSVLYGPDGHGGSLALYPAGGGGGSGLPNGLSYQTTAEGLIRLVQTT